EAEACPTGVLRGRGGAKEPDRRLDREAEAARDGQEQGDRGREGGAEGAGGSEALGPHRPGRPRDGGTPSEEGRDRAAEAGVLQGLLDGADRRGGGLHAARHRLAAYAQNGARQTDGRAPSRASWLGWPRAGMIRR